MTGIYKLIWSLTLLAVVVYFINEWGIDAAYFKELVTDFKINVGF